MKKAIGTRIRKLRVSKEYTQDNMAAELEITAGAYAKIERGETDPSATRLIQIAEILGVEVIYFFQESSTDLQMLDQHARYGTASQLDMEQLNTQMGLLKKEIEKIKAELALIRKPKTKK